jgi:predicted ArsR family transcriptional regulator
MRRCPFHDLAETHPEVICSLHHGLASGALEEIGGPLEVRALRPFVEPGLCVLELSKGRRRQRGKPAMPIVATPFLDSR